MEDEVSNYEPTESEIALYYISSLLDTIIEQMLWLKELVEQELDRIADEEGS